MGVRPQRKRQAWNRRGHRRTLPNRASAFPDRAKPPTWRTWKAQNRSKRWYWRYPLAVEWVLEWFVCRLRSLALFDLLELAGRCTVLVVAIFWMLAADNRAKERHYRAWDLINSARGSTGDGGRIAALQDLNKDGVSLAAAPLEQAYLPEVDLKGADLVKANLGGAILGGATLKGAHLQFANLQDANLGGANLWRANLWGANLKGANLEGAYLEDANLWGANLKGANLKKAILGGANRKGANLKGANLEGAYLEDANPGGASPKVILEGTSLKVIPGASPKVILQATITQEQLDTASGDDQTQLPEGLTRPAHWSRSERNEGQLGDGTTRQ